MDKAGTLFFVSWLLVGCTVEESVESPANMAVTLIAVAVAIACAWVMGRDTDGSDHE